MSVTRWRTTAALAIFLAAGCSSSPSPSPSAEPSLADRTSVPSPAASASASASVTASPPSSPPSSPGDDGSARGDVLLAIGDSVTFGIGSADPTRRGFPALVARRLGGLRPVVLAVPGETASGFLERRLDDVETAIDAAGPRLALVTVALGANEVLRVRREPACVDDRAGEACAVLVDAAIDRAATALDRILAGIERSADEASATPVVLVLAYYNPDVDPLAAATIVGRDGRTGCEGSEERRGLNDRIACVAAARDAVLVDLHAAFLGREAQLTRIEAGDVHPNDRGYRVIARVVADAYRRATR